MCFSYPENLLVSWSDAVSWPIVSLCQKYQKADEHYNTTEVSEHVPTPCHVCMYVWDAYTTYSVPFLYTFME